ncbi:MAG: hypothetical protein R3F61_07220 [Myxococcota bacterium]
MDRQTFTFTTWAHDTLRVALRERVELARQGVPVPDAVRAQLAKLAREA